MKQVPEPLFSVLDKALCRKIEFWRDVRNVVVSKEDFDLVSLLPVFDGGDDFASPLSDTELDPDETQYYLVRRRDGLYYCDNQGYSYARYCVRVLRDDQVDSLPL